MTQRTLHITTIEEELDRVVYKIDKHLSKGEFEKIEEYRDKLERILDGLGLLTEEKWKNKEKANSLDTYKKKVFKYLDIMDGIDIDEMVDDIDSEKEAKIEVDTNTSVEIEVDVDDITDDQIEAEIIDEENILFPELEVSKEDSTSKTMVGKLFSFISGK